MYSCISNQKTDIGPWVGSTLLNFIEHNGFIVCYDERDFP